MAYIAPNSIIKFLRNVPLDDTYEHTIYFQTESAQRDYFNNNNLIAYALTEQSYQRVQKSIIRVQIPADNLYTCNYLMFQNTSFGNKWFYAFIDSVEYINNNVSEISFTLDVLQTWHFDYQLTHCFIERQHQIQDGIGSNILPEPVELGEYVYNKTDNGSIYEPIIQLNDYYFVVSIVDASEVTGAVYDGIYQSALMYAFTRNELQDMSDLLEEYIQRPESILSIHVVPQALISSEDIDTDHKITPGITGYSTNIVRTRLTGYEMIDGYTPKNKKLYSYPYNFYNIDNANGDTLPIRYEFCDNYTPTLVLEGTITNPVIIILRPASYKGTPSYSELSGYTTLNTESIQLNNFPMCSWLNDAYQAWLAQNSGNIFIKTLRDVGIAIGGTMLNPIIGGVTGLSLISNVMSTLSDAYTASIKADVSRGSANHGSVNCAVHKQTFYGGRVSVNRDYAKMIDDFFSRFGYAIKNIGIPLRNARPEWTYVKTGGCSIKGTIPKDDANKICKIYDNGITWWRHPDHVGNYGVDNSPFE